MRIRTYAIAISTALAVGCAHPRASVAGPVEFDLVVAATTDVHGRLRGWNYETNREDPVRGLARAASIVDSLRDALPGHVVLLDAGDLLQGNSLTYVAARVSPPEQPHPVMAAMNAMRYDASAVGNHEFNYGVPYLEKTLAQARFPFLAANGYRVDGSRAFRAWTIVERGGARIGIVGASTPGSMVWDRDNLRGRIVMRDIVPEVRTAVGEARAAGAEIVLVTMHSGLNEPATYDTVTTGLPSDNVAERIAREVAGVDLVVYGHSHRENGGSTINGVLLVQAKNWAQSVAVAHLGLARENGRWRVASRTSSLVQSAGHREASSVLAATELAHLAAVSFVTAPIARTPVAWRADSARVVDTPLIDLILEIERRATGADLASTAAFSLDAAVDSGAITAANVQALYPYDNTLKVVKISGRQLREYLEFSAKYYRTAADGAISVDPSVPGFNFDIVAGADYTLDVSRPIGERLTRLERNGRAIAPTDSLTLALTNYRQAGGGSYTMLVGAPVVLDKGQDIRQLIFDEVKRAGTIRPEVYFTRNWRIEPASAVSSLYRQLRGNNREDGHAIGADSARVSAARADSARRTTPRADADTRPAADRPVPTTRLRILGVNDFHGALEPRPDNNGKLRGGAAYLAGAIRDETAACRPPACETLIVDGGDEFQGTPASNFAFGKPVTRVFNQIGVAAAALGNHEFDWGLDTLRARMRDVRYRFLGANVRYTDGRDVPWIQDDTLIVRGRLRIGVIGLASVLTGSTTRASNVSNFRFDDPAPIVDRLARQLRSRGADYVIVLAHDGAYCDRTGETGCDGEIITLARSLRARVDAIISGHTHSLVNATISGIPIVQARSSGTALDVVDLGPDGVSHRVRDVVTDSIRPDPAVAAIVKQAVDRVASRVNKEIATIDADLTREGDQYPLGNLLADAMRSAAKGDVAVMNNGGIRATLHKGPATYGSLFEVQPFGNMLYRVTITGESLTSYLQKLVARRVNAHVSGVSIVYDSTKTGGARFVSATLAGGKQIDPASKYTLVLNDFLATGGDGLGVTRGAIKSEILDVSDLDAMIAYLRTRPQPVQASAEVRIVNRPSK
ncbi:MAG TPA: 5'-nucleotidase C-terminal domain-containing protein [Gemmatimonadaceae bacterium]|nr:5'-nucleotidase C-terminal domain-containing protein [Gemmatimonadaceae bacterium]